MKCTPIKLQSRLNIHKEICKDSYKEEESGFVTNEFNGYSASLANKRKPTSKKPPKVSIKMICLPEHFPTYEAGYSLAKWSKKRPRLSANKTSQKQTYVFDQDYNENYSFSEIIKTLDEESKEPTIEDENKYEIDSDVEELIRRSQQRSSIVRTSSKERSNEKRSKKKIKHKLKKTVKFSFSKPASPETEQIIRVDVTSNISVETLRHMEMEKGDSSQENSNKSLDGNGLERQYLGKNVEKDLILKCSQLSISSKTRK